MWRARYGSAAISFPDFLPTGGVTVNGVLISGGDMIITAFALGSAFGLFFFFGRTRTGKAMTAVEGKNGKAPKYVKDLRKVMDDKDIDIVTIAMPNHWHVLASIWAIQSGKDVYVEKPLGHNIWEQRKLVEAARKHEKIVQMGNYTRSLQSHRSAIEFLRSGKLGKIKVARGICYGPRASIRKLRCKQPLSGSLRPTREAV